jgi:hypothetical protein
VPEVPVEPEVPVVPLVPDVPLVPEVVEVIGTPLSDKILFSIKAILGICFYLERIW